jgi:hypothetical protein
MKAGRACLAAFIVYIPETKKPQVPKLEPARGFCSAIDSSSSTDFTPARQAKIAAKPKVKLCKRPTLIIHSGATLMIFSVLLGNKKPQGKQGKNLSLPFSSSSPLCRIILRLNPDRAPRTLCSEFDADLMRL